MYGHRRVVGERYRRGAGGGEDTGKYSNSTRPFFKNLSASVCCLKTYTILQVSESPKPNAELPLAPTWPHNNLR